MGSGHDDGAGKVWLAQIICRLVYSVYQDNGGSGYYSNGTASTAAGATVAGTEMVMTTTTNVNKLLLTEALLDQLDCGGTWTLDCRRTTKAPWPADGALTCTDAASGAADAVVRLYLPGNLSVHFDRQPTVSVSMPETARRGHHRRGDMITVVRCDGGDENQVTCLMDGELWPSATADHGDDVVASHFTTVNGSDAADSNVTDAVVPVPAEGDQRRYNWKYLFVIVFIASGGVGNILVCLAICLDRQLQNVTNYFLLSLAIADLLVCLFVMPLGAIPGFYGTYLPVTKVKKKT